LPVDVGDEAELIYCDPFFFKEAEEWAFVFPLKDRKRENCPCSFYDKD